VLILALLVGVLEAVTIPIERRYVEATLKDSLVAGADWIGQAAWESIDIALSDLSPAEYPTFQQVLSITETFDLARPQALADQMRSDDVAYVALVNEEGTIVLSGQLVLIGEQAPLPSDARIEETTWRGESVWVASTPLRRGREGEQQRTGAVGQRLQSDGGGLARARVAARHVRALRQPRSGGGDPHRQGPA